MRADLIKRLERLERQTPPVSPMDGEEYQVTRLITLVLAYDRGGLQEHEPIMVGYARALGYEDEDYRVFLDGLRRNPAHVSERHGEAIHAFFVTQGLIPMWLTWTRSWR